jgi:hypothetical protein
MRARRRENPEPNKNSALGLHPGCSGIEDSGAALRRFRQNEFKFSRLEKEGSAASQCASEFPSLISPTEI